MITILKQFNLRQKARLAPLVLIACSAFSVSTANADTIQAFNATGTFVDGASLSGTVTVNTTTGIVTASSLAVSAPDALAFNFVQFQQSNVSGLWTLTFGTTAVGLPNLNIGIATIGSSNPMIGYTGGTVASNATPVIGAASDIFYSAASQVVLSSGSFTLPAATAVPALALLALGAAPLAFFGARRRRSHLAK